MPAFSPQQRCDPPIPVSRIFQRQFMQPFLALPEPGKIGMLDLEPLQKP